LRRFISRGNNGGRRQCSRYSPHTDDDPPNKSRERSQTDESPSHPLTKVNIQAFDYPNALVVCQRGPIACVANAEKYELMDLERGQIPLFPIMQNVEFSEDAPSTEPTLLPLMVSVGEEDFLVTTGTTIKDPAIGMFVNLNGDPVRGSLMFSTYPRAMSMLSS
jgi:hypothetical protein